MDDVSTSNERPRMFPVTQWTEVLAAGSAPSPESMAALERLCQSYWYPLYAYVRRCGRSPADAQDLTQSFFAELIEHNWVARAERERGRFRSFLLMAMKRFLIKEWEKQHALKRGGQAALISLQLDTAETRYSQEPNDTCTPEQVFEKQWALALLQLVLRRLRDDFVHDGRAPLFEALEPCLVGSRETQPYASLAIRLGMSEGAVKVAVHRMRERYRELLKEEISQTVASPSDVDEELRHLFRVLARR